MTRENQEEQNFRGYSKRKKQYIKRRNMLISVVLAIVVVVSIIYLIFINNRNYHNYKTVKSTDIAGENSAEYINYGSSVIKIGKDGAAAYDKDGKMLWNGSYNMSDPIWDTCGKYIVVADRGNKSVHIFDEKGEVGNYTTIYNIQKVRVASQGVVAALMQEGDNNLIRLYDIDGNKLGDIAKTINNTGYPLDIALSDNGQKLVAIYLSVTTGDLVSNIVCYNFGDVGKNLDDQTAGGYKFDKGIVVPRVEFLNNNTFCAYKDNGFVLYSMSELPGVIKEINLKGKIVSIFYNNKYTGAVLEAENGSSKHLLLYDLKGRQVLDKKIDYSYKRVILTDKEIIFNDDLSCVVMKLSGKVKFKYSFDNNITALSPINNFDRYFLINEAKLSVIQLN